MENMLRKEKICMELNFSQDSNVTHGEKAKEFWKFVDSQKHLRPYKQLLQSTKPNICSDTSKSDSLTTSINDIIKKQKIWRDGLRVFKTFKLDKVALTANNKCNFCSTEKELNECRNLPDTVLQTYEELNDELTSFEQRIQSNNKYFTEKQ